MKPEPPEGIESNTMNSHRIVSWIIAIALVALVGPLLLNALESQAHPGRAKNHASAKGQGMTSSNKPSTP